MTTVFVVQLYQEDAEGTFLEVVGVATTEAIAEGMRDEHKKRLLAKRSKAYTNCKVCGFTKDLHDPNGPARKKLEEFGERIGRKPHIDPLIACSYVAPEPMTELCQNEGYQIEPMELDQLPKEEV